MALESSSWGERLRRPRRSTVNSRLPKQMVLPRARQTSVGLMPMETKESFGDVTIRTSRGKARYKSPFLACQLSVFFAPTRIGWSRSIIPVLRPVQNPADGRCFNCGERGHFTSAYPKPRNFVNEMPATNAFPNRNGNPTPVAAWQNFVHGRVNHVIVDEG
jgi:hypothetical protein